jgi:cytidylate kinase
VALAPVLTIDGPTASGKGTIAARVAAHLGWHLLDSGALYRLTALRAIGLGVNLQDASALGHCAQGLQARFEGETVWLDGQEVTLAIRAEPVSQAASAVAVHAQVRTALLQVQRDFAIPPGLVADGRDMGTVVFPQAFLKIYLTASVESRALRRYKQLIDKGFSANLESLSADLAARDARDSGRAIAPLRPAEDAVILDSTALTIEDTVQRVVALAKQRMGPLSPHGG